MMLLYTKTLQILQYVTQIFILHKNGYMGELTATLTFYPISIHYVYVYRIDLYVALSSQYTENDLNIWNLCLLYTIHTKICFCNSFINMYSITHLAVRKHA